MTCINCESYKASFNSKSIVQVKSSVNHKIKDSVKIDSKIQNVCKIAKSLKTVNFQSNSILNSKVSLIRNPKTKIQSNLVIESLLSSNINIQPKNSISVSRIDNVKADKFSGYAVNFIAYEKLFPVEDISFINKLTQENIDIFSNGDVYSSIDEGIFTGLYAINGSNSILVSDDSKSIIYPFNIYNDGDLEYKFKVNKPLSTGKKSYFAIRVFAPFDNYRDRRPQEYKIYNIQLKDPNNNLIIQYEDIVIRGDNNFTTYIAKPLINNLNLPTWNSNYPNMDMNGDYTITMSISFNCIKYPFNLLFNDRFEQTCIYNSDALPDSDALRDTVHKNLKISSIEIGSSGAVGIANNNFIQFHTISSPATKITKKIIPSEFLLFDTDNGIYPNSNTVWQNNYDQENTDLNGCKSLLNSIISPFYNDYIKLISSSTHPDSGRLLLKFSNEPNLRQYAISTNGEFTFGFTDKEFKQAEIINYTEKDIFFDTKSIKLEIVAKKETTNVPNYFIDVVGYSDDKLFCVTPAIGGFLQNQSSLPYNSIEIPDSSGVTNTSLSISEESLSNDSDYYQKDITPFGDHYHITTTPVVNSTNFQLYTIPLEIKYDENKLGKDFYSLSSFLDNLYIDISPLPVGAIISSIRLIIEHDPSDAISFNITGCPSTKDIGRKTFNFAPTSGSYNTSLPINQIPHGFLSSSDIKTNYARRWRGINNDVGSGAFDILAFDNYEFEFKYPTHPFLDGYVDLSNVDSYNLYNEHNQIIGIASGLSEQTIQNKLYQNVGWRLSDGQLFNNSPLTPYKSISWNNNIYDAFDRAIRVSGEDYYIKLENKSLSSEGWAVFIRFTPDNIVPENHIILSKSSDTDFDFILGYNENSQLYASANNGAIYVEDSLSWENYQYPLSVLVTYNDNGEGKLRLYTDNELVDDFNYLRGQSDSDNYTEQFNDITIGYSNSYDNDLPMFVHEFGLTSGTCNIVNGLIDRQNQQTSVSQFFKSHRMHFWQTGDTNYRSEQYQYIDDNVSDWHLGAFKICSFSTDFDFFTRRGGNDYLMHSLSHDGRAYSEIINQTVPNSLLLSGVSYHTQVENDFLRFDIANISDEYENTFYSIHPRITKRIPKGYNFNEQGLCVDTIVEFDSNSDLIWSDGSSGAKLIVSLYSNSLNDINFPNKDFGLVNRSIHKIENSGCFQKITSTFNFNDLIDSSEPWAVFDKDSYIKETKERLFANDINDMFLQYDLVYPSGSPFKTNLKIHTVNVRAEKALSYYTQLDQENFVLYCSGDFISENTLNFVFPKVSTGLTSKLPLFASGDIFNSTNTIYFQINSETFFSNPESINLFTHGISDLNSSISLQVSGNYFSDYKIDLFTSGSGSIVNNNLHFITYSPNQYSQILTNQKENSINLLLPFIFEVVNPVTEQNIGLYISGGIFESSIVSSDVSLFVTGQPDPLITESGTLPLFVLNYAASDKWADRDTIIKWNSTNVGVPTILDDQKYFYVDQDDEIRGVDIICYGNCDNNISSSCFEMPIIVHDSSWFSSDCTEGGIFRAKSTYTNLDLDNGAWKHTENGTTTYSTDIMYSGHFYGTRKYTNLIPYGVYNVTIEGSTGSNIPIEIPPTLVEIEYNKLETDFENDIPMDYNGFKLINDDGSNYDYINNPVNDFGKSVSVKNDLLAIGAPGCSIEAPNLEDINSPLILENAGSVFLYRREDRPEGSYWPVDKFKSPWILEEILSLPSGLRSDYSVSLPEDNIVIDESLNLYLQKTRWFTGQNGRRFGHSVDLSINPNMSSIGENSRQIVVVGGPSAKFDREFDNESAEYVNIAILIFIDKFEATTFTTKKGIRGLIELTYKDIIDTIQNKDLIFDYFGDPRVKFKVNIILYVTVADNVEQQSIVWPESQNTDALHITVKTISRNNPLLSDTDNYNKIYNSIINEFNATFPSDTDIPPISVIYEDSSYSFKNAIPNNVITDFISAYTTRFKNANDNKDPSITKFVTQDSVQSENWILLSQAIINDLLNIQNLISRNQLSLLGTTIRTPSPGETREDYNIVPDSGGAVYIFEKESGAWNLIQEIKSPQLSYGYPDQFGHSVSISDNGEIIAIGSPYINEAVSVFEYKQDAKTRYYSNLYNWIFDNVSRRIKYSQAIAKYNENFDIHSLYMALTQEDKFRSRLDLKINEYEKIHTLSYSDIQPIGSWDFIPNAVAPTSRLGYSLDVNDDGDKIVVGAPTDSMNLYNDADVYYAHNDQVSNGCDLETYMVSYNGGIPGISSSWASSVNAGAIYVLESRKYYPHDTVMEYGRFGNLHRKLNKAEDDDQFDLMSTIFYDKEYLLTDQVTNAIPQEVGLLFIVTPEQDVLSDEVVENIINWLALGDRNLVLVGNDPIWEANGAYNISNRVINKLLRKLDSRMQLLPARNKTESLHQGYTNFNNIVRSYVPYGTTSTSVQRLSIKGSGVADIRMYYGDNSSFYVTQDCREVSTCMDPGIKIQIQDKCALPLMHNGDLRAEWALHCCNERGSDQIYYRNWALEFGSYTPPCADQEFLSNPNFQHEPIPLLTAAEKVSKIIDVPPVPAKYGIRYLREDLNINEESFVFTDPVNNNIALLWDENNLPSNGLNINYTSKTNINRFYKPTNEGVLEATSELRVKDIEVDKKIILDTLNRFAVSEKYAPNTKSEIVLVASVQLETKSLLDGDITGVVDYDKNIRFYQDLVNGYKSVAQLSLWDDQDKQIPSTFKEAFSDSIIADILKNYIVVKQGVNADELSSGYLNTYGQRVRFDMAWISNIAKYDLIDEDKINKIKNWLNQGNKKLVVTFDYYATEEQQYIHLEKVNNLCNQLGLSIKPLSYNGLYSTNNGGNEIIVNGIENYSVSAPTFHPISIYNNQNNINTLAYQDFPIDRTITELLNGNYWYMNAGIAKASFTVSPNTGYRLFIKTERYSDQSPVPISVNIGNANSTPKLPSPDLYAFNLFDFNSASYVNETVDGSISGDVLTYTIQNRGTEVIDVQTGNNQTSLDIYISSNIERVNSSINSLPPKTVRLVAISGIQININSKITSTFIPNGGEIIGTEEYLISEAVPGYSINTDLIRPISSDNTIYCSNSCLDANLGNQDIEDGPIVAAQEIEFITSFNSGYERSRITVLSDANMIQGAYLNENGIIPDNTFNFIRSLYPNTTFEYTNSGRQFVKTTKLISPERGSPTKYLSYINKSLDSGTNTRYILADSVFSDEQINEYGINTNFGEYSNISKNISNFVYESQYNPNLVVRPKVPWHSCQDGEKIEEIKQELVSGFYRQVDNFASFCRFSGIIDGVSYLDATIQGGIPQLFIDKGYDYLDLDKFNNGYPGDLFGYSVSIENNKIIVGSPFSAFDTENITPWSIDSELYLGNNGGAGAAYMFEQIQSNSQSPSWSCTKKFRPETLMGQLQGNNVYSDQFGRSVAIRGDVIAIGAPHHDYSNLITNNYGPFVRKSFNSSFDITTRIVQDLGNSGIRDELSINDTNSLVNSGAIYFYENRITNFELREKSWQFVEKVTNSDTNSYDYGKNIYLGKAFRTDSDYVLSVGCDSIINENYGTGIAYCKDLMLRSSQPALQNEDINIYAKLIGANTSDFINLSFNNNGQNEVSYYSEGLIKATDNGEILLEVSGQDPSVGGFIKHRPYIKSVTGFYNYGVKNENNFQLFVEGINAPPSSILNMHIKGE